MQAYWALHHSTHDHRALMSTPATYQDMLHSLLVSKGKNPKDIGRVRGGGNSAPNRPRRCTVSGGAWTEEIQASADAFAASGMQGDWARQTGSSPEAISWWLSQAGDS